VKLSIEAVILLVVTIAIVGAVSAWAMGYIGVSMAGAPDFTAQVDQCFVNKTYLKVKNLATTDIVGAAVKVGDLTCAVKYIDSGEVSSSKPIKPGDMVQLVVTGYSAKVGDRITFTVVCTFADGKVVAKDVQGMVRSF